MSGVAYAQRVVHSERERFEKQHGWVIKTMERVPSGVRDEYAAVIFAQETVSYLESIDMMSGEVNVNTCELIVKLRSYSEKLFPRIGSAFRINCTWI